MNTFLAPKQVGGGVTIIIFSFKCLVTVDMQGILNLVLMLVGCHASDAVLSAFYGKGQERDQSSGPK